MEDLLCQWPLVQAAPRPLKDMIQSPSPDAVSNLVASGSFSLLGSAFVV